MTNNPKIRRMTKLSIALLALVATLSPASAEAQTPEASVAQEEARAPRARSVRVRGASQVPAPNLGDRPTYSFQISLLLADVAGKEGSVGLSPNAQKALEDLKDFLPFKSYRLLDFAWLRTSTRSSAQVNGPDGKTYELSLNVGFLPRQEAGKIYISKFDLRDTSGLNLDVEAGPLRGPRGLISTSFGMDEGETVVVGTSRLDGEQKALVVLLTAVPTSVAGK